MTAARSSAASPSERGVALITVLLVVTIAAVMAAEVAWRQQVWTRQVENLRDAGQARALLAGALDWIALILGEDRRKGAADHLAEAWAQPIVTPVEYGSASGRLVDAQACFNLNNLVADGQASPADVAAYRRLLAMLGLPAGLADALLDWLDADDIPNGNDGAEQDWYAARHPPRLAANQPLAHPGELALVRGYDRAALERLAPYVCALPETTAINLNTASVEVLQAYLPGLDRSSAQAFLAARRRGFVSLAAARAALPPQALEGAALQRLDVASRYFMAYLRLELGQVRQDYEVLLARDAAGAVRTVWVVEGSGATAMHTQTTVNLAPD